MTQSSNFKGAFTRELKLIVAIGLLAIGGLCYWHWTEVRNLERHFIAGQLATVLDTKRETLQGALNSIYTNIRTISLLPSVRDIKGGNRESDGEDIIRSGRFTEEGRATVQQIYNNLASRVNVSEIYAVIDGLDAERGQIPFFMFDSLVFNDLAVGGEDAATATADTPEQSEDAEYHYFPRQIAALKARYPRFDFAGMDGIPAHLSPLMRTCDNAQYRSKAGGDPKNTFGLLYSVPFYSRAGDFRGVISAILRANVLEALLMDVPFVPVTPNDVAEQRKAGWEMPRPARFILDNPGQGIRILDRRDPGLPDAIKGGVPDRNVFQVALKVHGNTPWTLTYYLPESMFSEVTAAHNLTFVVLLLVVLGALVSAGVATVVLNRLRERLGGKAEAVADVVQAVSDGNLGVEISPAAPGDSVLGGMRRMLARLRQADEQSRENARIRQALEGVSTHVMLADADARIIFRNQAANAMLATFPIEAGLQQRMVGNRQRSRGEAEIGGRRLAFSVSPVLNPSGETLGSVLEWSDRTEEARVEQELAALVSAAAAGDFSQRIELSNKSGFFAILGTAMNQLMTTSENGLRDVARVLGAVSRGELTETIENNYAGSFGQLRDDTNRTVANLKDLLGEIVTAVQAINNATREIAAGNTDLARRTFEQTSNAEETAATMQELATTVKQSADNAEEASRLAIDAATLAATGGGVVSDVVRTMEDINHSARRISEIIGVIDGIAFQTNILALNASVEAARAGEQGRGFAVVASEVRMLAQRSATAARDIRQLIGESVERIQGGSRQAVEAGQTMEHVVSAVERVSGFVKDIATASREQSDGIDQASRAISAIESISQQNAALVEQSTAAAASLEDLANSLSQSVGRFTLDHPEETKPALRRASAGY